MLWPSEAKRIAGVELGLHFNLTEGTPLSPDLAAHWPVLPGLAKLLALAHLRRLPAAAIAASTARNPNDPNAKTLRRIPCAWPPGVEIPLCQRA